MHLRDNSRGGSLYTCLQESSQLEVLPGWKLDVLFPNNIMKGCDFLVIFQKLRDRGHSRLALQEVSTH